MSVENAEIFWTVIAVYLAIGAAFAIHFSARGVDRIDSAASDAGFFFRLLVFPGAAALWPMLLLIVLGARDRKIGS